MIFIINFYHNQALTLLLHLRLHLQLSLDINLNISPSLTMNHVSGDAAQAMEIESDAESMGQAPDATSSVSYEWEKRMKQRTVVIDNWKMRWTDNC